MLSMRIKSPSPSDSPRGKSSRGEPTHFNPPSTGNYPHVQRPDPRIIVILKCSQSFANILEENARFLIFY